MRHPPPGRKPLIYDFGMNLRRIGHSLMFRLVVMGLVLGTIGAVLRFSLLTQFLRQDLEQVISAQQVALAGNLAHEVEHRLTERRAMLAALASALPPELLPHPAALRAWLQERHRLHPVFDLGLVVTDAGGRVLADSAQAPARTGASFSQEADFAAVAAGQMVIGRPRIGPALKTPLLPMGAPVVREGRTLAVIIGTCALSGPGFLDLTRMGGIGATGGYLLISPQDRLFIASSKPQMVMKPTPAPGVNLLHDRAMAGYRGAGVTINAMGVEEISAMATVPSTGWFVVARIPTAEAFATIHRVQAVIARASVISFFVIVVCGSLVVWVSLRSLFRAAKVADRMTREEIPLAPLPVDREDEVGHLTRSFNRLLAKLEQTQTELFHQARHDTLTALPNRRLLVQHLHQALALARRNGSRLALLFFDLDGFKPINDTLGHDAGDQALRQVARRLAGVVRSSDTLARVGGDEFVLLATDLDAQATERMGALAQKCHDALAEPLVIQGRACQVGVSIGIAIGDGSTPADHLLGAADSAMYDAKHAGGSRHVFAPAPAGDGPEMLLK